MFERVLNAPLKAMQRLKITLHLKAASSLQCPKFVRNNKVNKLNLTPTILPYSCNLSDTAKNRTLFSKKKLALYLE